MDHPRSDSHSCRSHPGVDAFGLRRWVHPGLLILVAGVVWWVPPAQAGLGFLGTAVCMIAVLGVLEAFAPYEARSRTERGELFGIVGFGVAAYLAGKLAKPASAALVSWLPFSVTLGDAPLVVQLGVGFVVVELCFYVWHRAGLPAAPFVRLRFTYEY